MKKLFITCILLSGVLFAPAAFSQTDESPVQLVERFCSQCHALQVMGRCIAGDCNGRRVVHVTKAPPWPMVLDWMDAMGAQMDIKERALILDYLHNTYPSSPFPVSWSKTTAIGEGGWDVVSLRGCKGDLYAGFEGNGSIFRMGSDQQWQQVANTDHYTVYGLTPFNGALYVGRIIPILRFG